MSHAPRAVDLLDARAVAPVPSHPNLPPRHVHVRYVSGTMSITERDFILRTIQQLGEVLSRIAGMRAAGKHDEALVEAQGCVGALLGPMRETIERLDAASAAMMLGDSARLRAYALVLAQRALTHRELGDTAQAAADQRRAVALFSSWTRSGAPMDDDVRAALASLASWS